MFTELKEYAINFSGYWRLFSLELAALFKVFDILCYPLLLWITLLKNLQIMDGRILIISY